MRGTGMGCYFDNPTHSTFGILSSIYQDLYHFAAGSPIEDNRIKTMTAYGNTQKK